METEKISKCVSCKHNGTENGWAACDGCIHDGTLKDRYEPMTNGDRIREMTDKELAELLISWPRWPMCKRCYFRRRSSKDPIGVCKDCMRAWLRSQAESEGEA